jgi:hypothetical protein
MNTRPFHFLINSFLVATRSSNKKLLTIAANHEGKLVANQADAVIAAILAVFTVVFDAYKAVNINLMSALGFYKGETQSLESLFKDLQDTKLSFWEGKIFNFFPKGTIEATQLFPQNRDPFNKGTYETRIQAIATLAQGCSAFTDLLPVAAMITAFHLQIASARALQLSDGEGRVAMLRNLRESARVEVCQQLYGNLGLLMNHFKTDPLQIERFFDFSLLRSNPASSANDITAAGKVVDAITGIGVPMADLKFILPNNVTITVQTDQDGNFEAELGPHADTINVMVQVSKQGYNTFNEGGPVEPGEDLDMNVQLQPTPVPPPAPPLP